MVLPPLPYVIAGAAIVGIFMRRPSARSAPSTISPPSNDEGQYNRNPARRRNWRPCKMRSACADASFRPFGAHMVRVDDGT